MLMEMKDAGIVMRIKIAVVIDFIGINT